MTGMAIEPRDVAVLVLLFRLKRFARGAKESTELLLSCLNFSSKHMALIYNEHTLSVTWRNFVTPSATLKDNL